MTKARRPPDETPTPGPQARRVLVVDDDRDIRDMVGEILRDSGFDVESAADGSEALAAIEREPPDLMILDLTMPVVNGYEVLDALEEAETLQSIPVVIMTASMNPQGLRNLPILVKPVSVANLLQAARKYVH